MMRKSHRVLSGLLTALAAAIIPGCASQVGPPLAPDTAIPASSSVTLGTSGVNTSAFATFASEAAGPGGGWLAGASQANIEGHRVDLAKQANCRAEKDPATWHDVEKSDSADLNRDGFITLDEILAMTRAKLNASQVLDRISRTRDLFDISAQQEKYVRERGVDEAVIDLLRNRQSRPGIALSVTGTGQK